MQSYIKAVTTDGKTELFNVDRILNIAPRGNGTTKILMGAGLYWYVFTDSVEIVVCINDLLKEIKNQTAGGKQS